MKAENCEEARAWRSLIRGALDSYLEDENETGHEMSSLSGGNIHRLVQHRLKGDAVLLPYLTVVPKEKGLNAQNFKCAGMSCGFSSLFSPIVLNMSAVWRISVSPY